MLALCTATGAPAAAQSFSAPVPLSLNGHAGSVGVAVDTAGNAFAAWADEGMYYSIKPVGGTWSAPASVYVGGGIPIVRTTASGAATIVSYTNLYGIYSVDRAPGGTWTAPAVIVNAPQLVLQLPTGAQTVQFVSDPNGDQAIVFEQYLNGQDVITAVRRPAGGAWGPQDTIATSATYGPIALGNAALGPDNDLLVTFEPFSVVCSHYCHELNFSVHAAREVAGTTNWSDSGALTPASSSYFTYAMIDGKGRGALFIQNGFAPLIAATTQSKAGAKWRPLVNAVNGPPSTGNMMWAADASSTGQGSLAFVQLGPANANAVVLDGSLVTNTWPKSTVLSANDSPSADDIFTYGANAAGGAVAEWVDIDGTVRATYRRTAVSSWQPSQILTAGSPCNVGGAHCTVAAATGINAAGHGIAAFLRFDSNLTTDTLYVSTE